VVRVYAPYQNLVLDFDPRSLYNEASRQRKAYRMRPVEQIVNDIAEVQNKLNDLKTKKDVLVTELKNIHEYTTSALSGLE